jgi:hypothetical protein
MSPSGVLSRPSPCNVPPGDGAVLAVRGGRVKKEYASVAELPAALPAERRVLARRGWVGETSRHFEHPARVL